MLFGFYESVGYQTIKAPITADYKFGYSVLCDMLLDCAQENRQDVFRCLSMTYEKTAFHIITPFELL